MNVVCDVANCPHKNGKFCGKNFTIINQAGQCNEFYMDNGAPRPKPLFMYQQEYEAWFKNKEKETTTDDSKESDGEQYWRSSSVKYLYDFINKWCKKVRELNRFNRRFH